ncbi:TRIC cation channel family protein [Escherichia fergusonii]|uniref:Inner membrane protein n=1 Tax=Escherichia fergusonii (strain ATCC 35469 / DSM 13698 / CCUG 18766 / IAM 14443 / JCM 21226 / LMG 7866 / NBRC 102419 / NCTC 12128 / CDC 0568-73) TaxID=585054 RepID=B7LWB8_ESCF3|nr:TRIC cation channel family protein [Escherichia fergusonii]EIH2136225.1 TRIC cation channel family protein [Escherichia fergusonii]EIH2155770.1 TRIC cation channel family protein [Escherichia fergusonii]EIH9409471.1 TRIC cation channel family protein [Escherichia fergusonii]EIH9429166.1 TRIC cation channel family protein [Escherichia fergusonii]QQC71836.1 TRIC cation channel family protein [Escherichia fergusonii]
MLVYWLDIVGTIAFAISGVILAGKIRMDPFGVLVLAVVTAIGGGTIRDMALDNGPVFWAKDPTDLVVAMVTSMVTLFLVRHTRNVPHWILPVLDAIGLAAFVGIGVNKAFAAGIGPVVAVTMGVITGVGGGIIRDVLAREIPLILRTEIYAVACMIGGMVHVTTLIAFSVPADTACLMGMAVTLLVRLAAIRWNLRLPTFALNDERRCE